MEHRRAHKADTPRVGCRDTDHRDRAADLASGGLCPQTRPCRGCQPAAAQALRAALGMPAGQARPAGNAPYTLRPVGAGRGLRAAGPAGPWISPGIHPAACADSRRRLVDSQVEPLGNRPCCWQFTGQIAKGGTNPEVVRCRQVLGARAR